MPFDLNLNAFIRGDILFSKTEQLELLARAKQEKRVNTSLSFNRDYIAEFTAAFSAGIENIAKAAGSR
jgi:hypothetical protein